MGLQGYGRVAEGTDSSHESLSSGAAKQDLDNIRIPYDDVHLHCLIFYISQIFLDLRVQLQCRLLLLSIGIIIVTWGF